MNRILFVDDQPELLTSMRHMLRRFRDEWDMEFAEGGEAALEILAAQPMDVVVTDMRMPGMDGATLLARVKQHHPHVARIMLSGYSDSEAALRAVAVSHQYVSKPCRPRALQQTVSRVLQAQAQLNNPAIANVIGGLQKLPSPPALYHRLCALLATENATQAKAAELVSSDPAMTAKVLQLVNSAYFRTSREITDIREAIVYLGFEALSHLVLAAEVFGDESKAGNGVDLEQLQAHSLATARMAQVIAPGDLGPSAYTAALLHDVGVIVWSCLGELDAAGGDVDWSSWELDELQCVLGAYLLGLWGLPYSCVEVARYHRSPLDLELREFDVLATVHVAHVLVSAAEQGEEPDIESLEQFLEPLGVKDQLQHWIDVAADQILSAAA